MEEEKPGFEFRPYEEELVGFYLRHKILGNDFLVDGVIREFKICSLDPWDLRFQSKIKSRDLVWYFLSRRENNNGSRQSRRTPSGFWKLTGVPVDVKDQWGHLSGFPGKKIGLKRVLTFHTGNLESISINSNSSSDKNKSEWVMHELHYTLLPEVERTYVICRLEYKGDDVNILSADPTPTFVPTMANSASSVVDQGNSGYYNPFPEYQHHQFSRIFDMHESFQGYSDNFNTILDYALPNQSNSFSDHLNVQPPQVPYSAPLEDDWNTQSFEQRLDSLERTLMRDDPSHYRPKKPVTGVLSGDSSDSDTDSMIGTDAWSSTDSVGSKDGPYHTPKDNTPSLSTIEPLHNHEPQEQQKQMELQLQDKEKVINNQKSECEWKMAEDSTKKAPSTTAVKQSWIVLEEMSQRNPRWVHLNNMLIGLLLSIFIIGWIILVG
ncbi:hypothetical protein N665_0058s0061 [Sinapis alba]|nr:hypothetical protein N665_0058s0061 [Sinapis alba]